MRDEFARGIRTAKGRRRAHSEIDSARRPRPPLYSARVDRAEGFAAALIEVELCLDWRALGRLYCSEGGDDFFGEEEREAIRDAGLALASDLGAALAELPAGGPRRSLYVGAAVAELAPILCETIVLEREVLAFAADGEETRALDAALRRTAVKLGVALPGIEAAALGSRALPPCDHLWLVSVLNDPDAFPALHDELYGRAGTELATGRGDLADDRRRAEALLDAALAALRAPAVLTTTDEELELVARACAKRGLALSVPDRARLSAVVGDPVRLCAVR